MSDEIKRQYEKVKELKKTYLRVFQSEDGQTILADLERKCHGKATTFPKNLNALELARNEGRRQVFLYIKTVLLWDEERLQKMMEAQDGKEGG